jgi:hypothetical protein
MTPDNPLRELVLDMIADATFDDEQGFTVVVNYGHLQTLARLAGFGGVDDVLHTLDPDAAADSQGGQ